MKKHLLIYLLIFAASGSLLAQIGPGGIGDSSNLTLWLDADSINASNNSPITNWPDLSPNNNHAVQSSSTNQPILRQSSLNNHHVVEFDGTDDYLNLTSHISTDNVAIYMVINNTDTQQLGNRYALTTQDHEFLSKNASNEAGLLYDTAFFKVDGNLVSKFEVISGQTMGNSSSVLTSRRGEEILYNNRPALNSNTTSLVGAYTNGTTTSNFHMGNMAELIVFSDTLNPVERRILMNSLSAKYGNNMVNPSEDHYMYQNVAQHDVIGIGQLNTVAHTAAKGSGRVQISNPDDLSSGEFLFIGHNRASLDTNASDVPSNVESRLNRVWRADQTGNVGSISMEFYMDAGIIPNLSRALILIDDDGDFSNGGTDQHDFGRSVDIVNGFVSFDNVVLEDSAYFTLAVYKDNAVIRSVQSGDWNINSTWDCNCVPTLTNNVLIVDSHHVQLNSIEDVNTLNVTANAILDMHSNSELHIYDSLYVYGQLLANDNLIVAQNSGSINFLNYSGDTVSLFNLEVANPNNLYLDNGVWGIQNSLQVNAGQLVNNSTLIFQSNDSLTAQILESISNPFSGGGEYILQRYISTRKSAYANLAAPTSTNLSDWDQEIYMSGVQGIDGNAQYGPNGPIYYSVYKYNNLLQEYDTIFNVSEALVPGQGYELYLGDDLVQYTPEELGVVDVRGVPTSGNVTASTAVGFNLLGNPYQAFINWADVSKPAGASSSYYVFDANSGNYALYDSSRLVPPSQSFWVEIINSGGTVTFEEADKSYNNTDPSVFLRKKYDGKDSIVLNISNDKNDFWHKHFISINPKSSLAEDAEDRSYLPSRMKVVPAIYSTVLRKNTDKARKLMVNSISPYEPSVEIDLQFKAGVDAMYTLSFSNLADQYNCMLLEDKMQSKLINLKEHNEYSFYSKEGEYDRFKLLLKKDFSQCAQVSSDNANMEAFTIEKLNGEYYLTYHLDEADQIKISMVDAMGKKVQSDQTHTLNGFDRIRIQDNLLNGIYFIQVQSQNGKNFSQKILLNTFN